jgi:hypothetical protein
LVLRFTCSIDDYIEVPTYVVKLNCNLCIKKSLPPVKECFAIWGDFLFFFFLPDRKAFRVRETKTKLPKKNAMARTEPSICNRENNQTIASSINQVQGHYPREFP